MYVCIWEPRKVDTGTPLSIQCTTRAPGEHNKLGLFTFLPNNAVQLLRTVD